MTPDDREADTVAQVGRQLGRLSELIAADWPDDRGREWADRCALLSRELIREARAAVEPIPAGDPGPAGARAEPGTGMRLGGTDAEQTDDARGVRIAQLLDPAG